MKKNVMQFTFLLAIVWVITGSAWKEESSIIYWSEERLLSWDDFQAPPDFEQVPIGALTSSAIEYYTGCKDGKIIYKIQAVFEKDRSWVKEVARTEHHLRHEQVHFNITELYARKLRIELEKRSFTCEQKPQFEALINSYLDEWSDEQYSFDWHTGFSMRPEKQLEWELKVIKALHDPEVTLLLENRP